MATTRKETEIDPYNSHFAATLRELMETRGTTQKELAKFVNIRPQTISLYCTGATQPNVDTLLKIAEFFEVTTDYLITGHIIENIPVYEMLGLSENSVQDIKLVKDGYFEDSPYMLALLDLILSDKDFFTAMESAAHFQQVKRDDDSKSDYYDFKSTQALQDYFMDIFSKDIEAIYKSRRKGG